MISKQQIEHILQKTFDPNTQKDFVTSKALREIHIEQDQITLTIELAYPAGSQHAELTQLLSESIHSVIPEAGVVKVNLHSHIATHAVQPGLKPLPTIKNLIAIASGKGGVGKSTVAANLALALAQEGAQVGILDADIYGPSQPMMLGIDIATTGKPQSTDGKTIDPIVAYGIQANSIGFLIDPDQPMIWRGPMVSQALQQLVTQTHWNNLDYLIIDLPPGTGDIQLTLAQKIPVTGAVIVTTPQDIALIDAKKGLRMFEKVGIPILGVIENMAMHVCSQCGHTEPIFGHEGGKRLAQQNGINYLGSLPLDKRIREQADKGHPIVIAEPESIIAQNYQNIARHLAVAVATLAIDRSLKIPPIVAR